jgi:hypothetical protein
MRHSAGPIQRYAALRGITILRYAIQLLCCEFALKPGSCFLTPLLKKNEFLIYTGGPLCDVEICFSGITFLGAFCHESLYF